MVVKMLELFRGKGLTSIKKPGLRLTGPLITVATLAVMEVFRYAGVIVPNPVVIALIAVVYAAFRGGLWDGIASAAIVVAYNLYHFSEPGYLFLYKRENAVRLIIILVSVPAIAAMVALLQRRTEAAIADLRKSEKRLRDITWALGEGVIVFDRQRVITFANPEAERLLGWSRGKLAGKASGDVFPAFQPGEVYQAGEGFFPRIDGTKLPVAYVSTPIVEGEQVTGCVTAFSDITERKQAEEELRRLHQAVRHQNRFLEEKVRERTKELQDSRLEVIHRLGRAAEYRDNDTGLHTIRMSRYAAALGRAAGMTEAECELLLHASPLHDVGKIAIPDRILLKPGKLDPDEWEVMKTHAAIGAELLAGSRSELMQMAETIALTHHEKWDGSGYPRGLKGEEIPLVGRICALCDVFDALTSERPYKKAWSVPEAMAEIERGSGTHFDPRLVELFKQILPEIMEIRANTTAYGKVKKDIN